jgi:hypothetical protein
MTGPGFVNTRGDRTSAGISQSSGMTSGLGLARQTTSIRTNIGDVDIGAKSTYEAEQTAESLDQFVDLPGGHAQPSCSQLPLLREGNCQCHKRVIQFFSNSAAFREDSVLSAAVTRKFLDRFPPPPKH